MCEASNEAIKLAVPIEEPFVLRNDAHPSCVNEDRTSVEALRAVAAARQLDYKTLDLFEGK